MGFADAAALTFKIHGEADIARTRREVSGLKRAVVQELDGLTSVLTNNAGAFGRVAAGAGLAGAVIGVAGGAAVTAAAGVFTLAKNAADAGSRIYDLSQRTGISVETLSAFRLVARQSGTSLEEFAQGVSRFNRLIGEAASGSDTATAKLKRFGIEPQSALADQEAALAKVFERINALPPGIQRSIAAQEAFGKSGDRLVDMIQSVGGNLDKFMRLAREAGEVMSKEDAAAADKFGDSLDELGFRAQQVGIMVGQKAIPEITRAMQDLINFLKENRATWDEWASGIASAVTYARAGVEGFAYAVRQASATPEVKINYSNPVSYGAGLYDLLTKSSTPTNFGGDIYTGIQKSLEAARQAAAEAAKLPESPRRASRSGGGGGGGRRGGRSRRVESNADDITRREDERDYQQAVADARRDFDLKKTNIEQLANVQEVAEERRFIALRDGLLKQRAEIKAHGQERLNKEREIDDKLVDLQRETDNNIRRYRDDRAKAETDAEREFVKARSDIADERARREIERLRAQAEERVIVQSAAEERIGALQLEMHDRRVKLLRDGLNAELEGSAEHRRLQGEVSVAEVERAGIIEETERRVRVARAATQEQQERFARRLQGEGFQNRAEGLDVRRQEIEAAAQFGARRIDIIRELTENAREAERLRHEQALSSLDAQQSELLSQAETFDQHMEVLRVFHERKEIEQRRHQQAMGQINAEGKEHERGAEFLGPLRDAIGETADFTTFASQKIADAYQHIEGALGHATKAYVLYGASIGKALKQALAERLASVAAEAAIESLKHAAYAIGNLAIGNFASAAKHAAAAAAFGALAYGSASLGRSLVRSQESGGQSAAGGAVRESSVGRSSGDVRVIEESRFGTQPSAENRAAAPPQVIILRVESNDSHIVNVVENDIGNNGRLRGLVVQTAGA